MPSTRPAVASGTPLLRRRGVLAGALALPAALAQGQAQGQGQPPAQVVRLNEPQFRAGAGRITFSEVPLRSRNPVYAPAQFGGRPSDPTVRFAGHLLGRSLGRPDQCPPGAALSGCLAGVPRGPVALDLSGPPAMTIFDGSPSVQDVQLSGWPVFNGPIAILFDRDVAAVGLLGGHFNAVNGTAITVYDRQGRQLGRTSNRGTGREFLALATADLSQRIAALEFHLVGPEPAGFGVDNIRFGDSEQVDLPEAQRPPPPAPPPPPAAPPATPPAALAPLLL